MAAFTPERLFKIRRLRKARRLWRNQPLLAFEQLKTEYPEYTHEDFNNDLKRRMIKKKRISKCPLVRYGRYTKIQSLLQSYLDTLDPAFYLQAMKLKKVITRPYRVKFILGGQCIEYEFDATIPYCSIEAFVMEGKTCTSVDEIETHCGAFRNRFAIKN